MNFDNLERYTVFLGGTCNNSTWREELIPELERARVKYYNPVVPDWTPECQEIENKVKNHPNTINFFQITSDMIGHYSIAEAVDSSNKKPGKTVFCFMPEGFNKAQVKSLRAIEDLIRMNEAYIIPSTANTEAVAQALESIVSNQVNTAENLQ